MQGFSKPSEDSNDLEKQADESIRTKKIAKKAKETSSGVLKGPYEYINKINQDIENGNTRSKKSVKKGEEEAQHAKKSVDGGRAEEKEESKNYNLESSTE